MRKTPVELEIIVLTEQRSVLIYVFGIDNEELPRKCPIQKMSHLFTNTIGADKITDNNNGTYEFSNSEFGGSVHSGIISIDPLKLTSDDLWVSLKKNAIINI